MNMFAVQSALKVLGFDPGPIDGMRGPRTDAAIIEFKKSIGFRASRYLGPLTKQQLKDHMALAQGKVGDASDMPWMEAAAAVRGLHEQRNNAALQDWFWKSVAWIDSREIAWCGAFVETCHKVAAPECETVDNPLGARNWSKFGRESAPGFGATLVFWRGSRSSWKGHVGFYHAEDRTHFHVLGGNQRNAVTVTRIAKSRLLAARAPAYFDAPFKRIHVLPSGVPISTNEA
ncbi:MAG: peptidoglycan-binding protein [Pseudomonadota bacterium]